jgi:hypothetical protein
MNNEDPVFDPRQDEEYMAFLQARERARDAAIVQGPQSKQITHYRPGGAQPKREFTPQTEGKVWDKSKQQGEVFATLQRSYSGKGGTWYNGQLRVVIKDFKGNQFVSLENWKPVEDDLKREPHVQEHVWKGACNIQLKELRNLAAALNDLADNMDGGVVR